MSPGAATLDRRAAGRAGALRIDAAGTIAIRAPSSPKTRDDEQLGALLAAEDVAVRCCTGSPSIISSFPPTVGHVSVSCA
jgi:hypothetical protein